MQHGNPTPIDLATGLMNIRFLKQGRSVRALMAPSHFVQGLFANMGGNSGEKL